MSSLLPLNFFSHVFSKRGSSGPRHPLFPVSTAFSDLQDGFGGSTFRRSDASEHPPKEILVVFPLLPEANQF